MAGRDRRQVRLVERRQLVTSLECRDKNPGSHPAVAGTPEGFKQGVIDRGTQFGRNVLAVAGGREDTEEA